VHEEDIVVSTIMRSKNSELRCVFRIAENDRRYVDIRIWNSDVDGAALKPSSKGFTLAMELLPQLKAGVDALMEKAIELQWIE
jgi:hypothetical protein